jgi:hypothetical protein
VWQSVNVFWPDLPTDATVNLPIGALKKHAKKLRRVDQSGGAKPRTPSRGGSK